MAQNIVDKFFNQADAHIHLSNEQIEQISRGKVSTSMMYTTARFNSWVSVCGWKSSEEMQAVRDEPVEYCTVQFCKMLEENLDDYIANFENYMQKSK